MALSLFLLQHLFCLSHHKTHWTMSVDYLGLRLCHLGTFTFMVTLPYFLGVNQGDPGTNSTPNKHSYSAFGNFMVHDVKQPLHHHALPNAPNRKRSYRRLGAQNKCPTKKTNWISLIYLKIPTKEAQKSPRKLKRPPIHHEDNLHNFQ